MRFETMCEINKSTLSNRLCLEHVPWMKSSEEPCSGGCFTPVCSSVEDEYATFLEYLLSSAYRSGFHIDMPQSIERFCRYAPNDDSVTILALGKAG
jgi:hypothetical protein